MNTLFRTSTTDPLRIASVAVGQCGGRVGITICPGKQGESIFGRPWRRDLAQDLKVIAAWGACAFVSLIEEHELVTRLPPRDSARQLELSAASTRLLNALRRRPGSSRPTPHMHCLR